MRLNSHVTLAIYLGVSVALADQLSKWWLVNKVMQPPHTVEVTSFFNLVKVENKGVTFGLLNSIDHHDMSYILIGFALVVLFLLGRWLLRTHSTPVAAGLGLIMGGAIGNIIDRARFGAVVDFLDFYYRSYHWPAFNVADSGIVVGVSLLLLDSVLRAR